MKNFFLIALVFMIFTSCNNDSDDNVLPLNTVEGKWLWSPTENRADANTMYEFVNGTRYKYYGTSNEDWNALDSSDRIPGEDIYTFDENTLTINETANVVTFECDGGIMYFPNGAKFWRLSSDCN
jgi:hypothetical protein|uniref:Lipocalin-like domain-containing protein n=1 Tax=uncultured Flavobacteriia bacterium TaxID=212695 RepID=H6REI0_9BACT|nr:hypothetical protein [uncultured bacterium]CCF99441.1 conserved hypothetical protein [uncultured Flavobacteriia bacterium]